MTPEQVKELVERLDDIGCDREPFTDEHAKCRCRTAYDAKRLITLLVQERDELREALRKSKRGLVNALFVIRKQGAMPNSSWESGLESDLAAVRAALAE